MATPNKAQKQKFRNEPTFEQVAACFRYDPETGQFWKKTGYTHKGGYGIVSIFAKNYKAHRVAWLLMTKQWPTNFIDHINGKPSDNSFKNLRLANYQQQAFNRKVRSDNKSGYTGVFFMRANKKWTSYIYIKTETAAKYRQYLGLFDTKDDAISARKHAEKIYFGEFARSA